MLFYSDGRVTISPSATRKAGFSSGDRVTVIVNSPKSFDVLPAKRNDDVVYRVDMYGRLRISENLLRTNGVQTRASNNRNQVTSSKRRIAVSL